MCVCTSHTLNCHYLTEAQTNRDRLDVAQHPEGSAVAPSPHLAVPPSPLPVVPRWNTLSLPRSSCHVTTRATPRSTWAPSAVGLPLLSGTPAQTLDSAAATERGQGRGNGGEDEGRGRWQTEEAAVRTELWRREDMEFEDEPSVRVVHLATGESWLPRLFYDESMSHPSRWVTSLRVGSCSGLTGSGQRSFEEI